MVIGDSFAHGAGLQDGEDSVSLLRKQFPDSVNLGNGGNGPLTALATLREYGSKLKPRVVMYWYNEGNDLAELEMKKETPLLMRYLEDPGWFQNLYLRHTVINTTLLNFAKKQIRKYCGKYPLGKLRQTLTLSHLRRRIGLNLPAEE